MTETSRNGTREKHPGSEPLSGYRLLKILGRGGFGEVWKCEAPGGLHKAIKFVKADGDVFEQELAAFERIKSIRHPFLLSLERVELVDQELVMVMELADCQTGDRFRACRAEGWDGIPREELLRYLGEAAEALDTMSSRHGLQHLDVKPENLFLFAGHVKVGDYGLVQHSVPLIAENGKHGFTPRYASPEVLKGKIDARSDQYSLALVYVELLTGRFPYSGRTANEFIFQHCNSAPDLSMLPSADQSVIARALSKNPGDRFPSCSVMIQWLASLSNESVPDHAHMTTSVSNPVERAENASEKTTWRTGKQPEKESPNENSPSPAGAHTPPPVMPPAVPQLRVERTDRRVSARARRSPTEPLETKRLVDPVVSVDLLHGMPMHHVRPAKMSPSGFMRHILELAINPTSPTSEENSQTSSERQFLCTLPFSLVPYKLLLVGEQWGLSITQPDATRVALKYQAPPAPPPTTRAARRNPPPPPPPSGYVVVVHSPGSSAGQLTVTTELYGEPDADLLHKANTELPPIVNQICAHLQNVEERRSEPRFRIDLDVMVYPFYSDGIAGAPITGSCCDVSASAIRLTTAEPIRTKEVFFVFPKIEAVTGLAIKASVFRTEPDLSGQGYITVGRFAHAR